MAGAGTGVPNNDWSEGPYRWVERPLLGFDLETTAPDPFDAIPVSYSFVLRRPETMQMSVQSGLINPLVEIPAEATAIHGITTEQARAEGMDLAEALVLIKERLMWAMAERVPLVGMNVAYDLTVVDNLEGLDDWDSPVLDVFVLDKANDKWRSGSRKLPALAEHYGVTLPEELGGAHSASSDAAGSILVVLAMCERFPWLPAQTIYYLHKRQIAQYRAQQDDLSDYFVKKGEPAIPPYDRMWPIKRKGEGQQKCG
jgi:DNA polymerase-3 subunit epsilon